MLFALYDSTHRLHLRVEPPQGILRRGDGGLRLVDFVRRLGVFGGEGRGDAMR